MKNIDVGTGFGYYVNKQGHIVSKAELPIGSHPLADDFIYVDVADKQALDAIQIYMDPADIVAAENEQKIRNKMRRLAIDALKQSGDLPPDFVDPRKK